MSLYKKLTGLLRGLGQGGAQPTRPLTSEKAVRAIVERALVQQKDSIRVEVLQEVRGQMNRVFGVVDELKRQVVDLTRKNNSLTSVVEGMQEALTATNRQMAKLGNAVQDSASKNAKGFSDVNKRLNALALGDTAGMAAMVEKDLDSSSPDLPMASDEQALLKP